MMAKRQTDIILEQLEKTIKQEYTKAYKTIKEQINNFEFDTKLKGKDALIQAQKYNRLQRLEKQIVDILNNADKEAVRIINNQMVNVYQVSYNEAIDGFINKEAVKNLLTKEFDPFGKLALNKLKYGEGTLSKLTSELIQGTIMGESNNEIARRVKGLIEGNMSDAIRIARTETTRVENSAKINVGNTLKKEGFEVYKEWVSTNDERTREAHVEANGQRVKLDEPFTVGGEELMFPGDPMGSAWNVINCRCTIKNVIKGIDF